MDIINCFLYGVSSDARLIPRNDTRKQRERIANEVYRIDRLREVKRLQSTEYEKRFISYAILGCASRASDSLLCIEAITRSDSKYK